MTLRHNAVIFDPITRRPTLEFIREQARDHVAYGWAPSPGTHNREIAWTDDDTATYMMEFRAALAAKNQG